MQHICAEKRKSKMSWRLLGTSSFKWKMQTPVAYQPPPRSQQPLNVGYSQEDIKGKIKEINRLE